MLHTAFPASTWDTAEAPALQNKSFFIRLRSLQLQHLLAQLLLCHAKAEQCRGHSPAPREGEAPGPGPTEPGERNPKGWEGIPACPQHPCASESPWSQVCTPAQATFLLVMAPVEFLLLPGAVSPLHPPLAISPPWLPSAITPLVPSATTSDS